MKQRIAAAALAAAVAGGCMGSTARLGGGGLKPANTPSGNVKLRRRRRRRKKYEAIDPGLRRDAEAELARAYASTDAIVRANALEATQRTNGAAGAPRLIAALTDPAVPVRFAGAMACGTLKLQAARDRLLTMTADPNVSVQVAVRFAPAPPWRHATQPRLRTAFERPQPQRPREHGASARPARRTVGAQHSSADDERPGPQGENAGHRSDVPPRRRRSPQQTRRRFGEVSTRTSRSSASSRWPARRTRT